MGRITLFIAQSVNMRELILLDTDSTYKFLYNLKYVSNIQYSDNPLSIMTNGGLMKLHQKCIIPYINNVWYNGNSINNIISVKDTTAKFLVTMD